MCLIHELLMKVYGRIPEVFSSEEYIALSAKFEAIYSGLRLKNFHYIGQGGEADVWIVDTCIPHVFKLFQSSASLVPEDLLNLLKYSNVVLLPVFQLAHGSVACQMQEFADCEKEIPEFRMTAVMRILQKTLETEKTMDTDYRPNLGWHEGRVKLIDLGGVVRAWREVKAHV